MNNGVECFQTFCREYNENITMLGVGFEASVPKLDKIGAIFDFGSGLDLPLIFLSFCFPIQKVDLLLQLYC
jgi:hypothetical protein